jgi:hypothetical protein
MLHPRGVSVESLALLIRVWKVQIQVSSTGRDMMCDFQQSLQAKVGISSQITLLPAPSMSSPIHYSLIILSFNTIH